MPVDVFPYTRQELAAMWAEGAGVVRVARAEGLFLRGGSEDRRVISPCASLGCHPLTVPSDSLDRLTGTK